MTDSSVTTPAGIDWARLASLPGLQFAALLVAMFAAGVLVHLPSLGGTFVWDDDYHVSENRMLRSWDGLNRIWFEPGAVPQYYPLTHTAFWIEWRLWGDDPRGYKLVNIALHALTASMLWVLLRRLSVAGALAAALIFLLHPVHVESVAWITARKNTLSAALAVASLLVYLRYCGLTPAPSRQTEGDALFALPDEPARLWRLSAALFVLALLSKTIVAFLPAVVLVLIAWKRRRITAADLKPLLPFFAIGLAAAAMTIWMERASVGARGAEWDYAATLSGEIAARTLIAGRAVLFYLSKLAWPADLAFSYDRWRIDIASAAQWMAPLAVGAIAVALWVLRRRIGAGPIAAWALFVGMLFPALGYIDVFPFRYSFVADHFNYLSSVPLIALACTGGAMLLKLLTLRGVGLRVVDAAATLAVATPLAVLAHDRAGVFRDNGSLWRDVLVKTEQRSWMAANNYGVWLLQTGRLDDAEKWFRHAIRVKPDHAEAHHNLGRVAVLRDDPAQAIAWFEAAASLRPDNYADPHIELGLIEERRGNLSAAEAQFRRVIELAPRLATARVQLASVLLRQGRADEGTEQIDEAIDLDPESYLVRANAGNALLRAGRIDDALRQWAEAARLNPDDTMVPVNFGILLASNGYLREAEAQFLLALRNDPQSVEALTNLGIVEATTGRAEQAMARFDRVLQLAPGFQKAEQWKGRLQRGEPLPQIAPTTRASAPTPAAAAPATAPAGRP